MKRWPLLPTLLVALAIAAMLALGGWQLGRRAQKQLLVARAAANLHLPVAALPRFPDETMLFRRVSTFCLSVTDWQVTAGRAADGSTGWRHVAGCRTGVDGPGLSVEMGVSADPKAKPAWTGGPVTGVLARVPQAPSWQSRIAGRDDAGLALVVADSPAPGLRRSQPPDPAALPNNHLGYAIQWFAFAAMAGVIYVLALRRRRR